MITSGIQRTRISTHICIILFYLLTVSYSLKLTLKNPLGSKGLPTGFKLNRGDRYKQYQSTIPHTDVVSSKVGVIPPLEAPKQVWKRAWVLHSRLLPLLHAFDKCKPSNSALNLACIWWKAIAGNDRRSPVFDDGLAYDFLPGKMRGVVNKRLVRFYPRLHHANVEIRTAYLDQAVAKAVDNILARMKDSSGINQKYKIRLISIGAGYDTRSLKFRLRGLVDEAYEFDLPEVVEAKQRLLERSMKRRNDLSKEFLPHFVGVDLNETDKFKKLLKSTLANDKTEGTKFFNIILFEGVMIYLKETVPSTLLRICSDLGTEFLLDTNNDDSSSEISSLCFADRLENIPGGDETIAKRELNKLGWEVIDWLPKPGLARHMGVVRLIAE